METVGFESGVATGMTLEPSTHCCCISITHLEELDRDVALAQDRLAIIAAQGIQKSALEDRIIALFQPQLEAGTWSLKRVAQAVGRLHRGP